ncbi:Hsp33 family molecular chaperone HslO [Aggregicoccus sp. 17bor-14]|uniref:Hsp33 family molecular chaperone HslO n=1 Tax=Myxococcaceae TaxID=31 RepID=UPI00129CD604|nr:MULTISPECIES: Hsp33 family molecular chaperone HslO [Myxococcaceae]MBF5045049.1 Hsp33 family molecular chaperone HslO [Simulacricoccus sp. 17bor-14]MRI90791.1 Hsp33 family molecular chaperone HslO [Aggregicoccus sp. 17bor-14]
MADELVSGLLKDVDLRVVLVTAGTLVRKARALHSAEPAAAALLAQGLTGAALLAALQKEKGRINLQLECDGPVRGMFADAEAGGTVRGYLKNPYVSFTGGEGRYHWRPVLGNSGFLSVLRDLGKGEYYRSSVELQAFDFPQDLERYFTTSEQVQTRLAIELLPSGSEPLGQVVGVLVQPLPDGDLEAFRELGAGLSERLVRAATEQAGEGGAAGLLRALFPRPDLEVMSRYPLDFECGCSRERVKRALLAMGRAELEDVLATDKKAEATCQFCTTQYVISEEEIRELVESATKP